MTASPASVTAGTRPDATIRRLEATEADARILSVILDATRVQSLQDEDERSSADLLKLLSEDSTIALVAQMPALAPVACLVYTIGSASIDTLAVLSTYEHLDLRSRLVQALNAVDARSPTAIPSRPTLDRSRPAILRRAQPTIEDARMLSRISQTCFLETFSDDHSLDGTLALFEEIYAPSVLLEALRNPEIALWLLLCDDRPIGHAMIGPAYGEYGMDEYARETDIFLKRIYVLDNWQGTGQGSKLYKAILAEAKARRAGRLLLTVYTLNKLAIAFYERKGFKVIGFYDFRLGSETMRDMILALELSS